MQEKRALKPKRRVRRKDAGGEGRAVQKKRKRRGPQVVEQDLSQLPPEEGACTVYRHRPVTDAEDLQRTSLSWTCRSRPS